MRHPDLAWFAVAALLAPISAALVYRAVLTAAEYLRST